MKKKYPTIEEQLKKYKCRFYTVSCIAIVLLLSIGFYLYLNYDYLVFKHFISQHYIYTDALDNIFQDELKRDVKGKYYSYFDNLVISVVTRRIRQENNDRYTYLYIPEQYRRYKEEEKKEALQSEVRAINDFTLYMRITNFSVHTKKFVADNIEMLKQYPNLIIDLRDNYGGDIFAMNNMADWFLPKGSTLATDDMRLMDWIHKTKKSQVLHYDHIVILQNQNSASASENFIAALKDNLPNVTLVGETTFGKGIGQYTLNLKRGFAVKATTMQWYTPNGKNIHRKGIAPDIRYTGEDIIQYAVKKVLLQ